MFIGGQKQISTEILDFVSDIGNDVILKKRVVCHIGSCDQAIMVVSNLRNFPILSSPIQFCA